MRAEMCNEPYWRDAIRVPCTFLKDHPTPNHSWFALRVQDEVDAEMATQRYNVTVPIPDRVVPLVSAITAGTLDDCLEVILTAAHTRKRARHGGPSVRTEQSR